MKHTRRMVDQKPNQPNSNPLGKDIDLIHRDEAALSYDHDNLSIKVTSETTNSIDGVYSLYKRNSGNLGHLPKGAFAEARKKSSILVALDKGNTLAYLLYNITRKTVKIVHLCVEKEHRNKGIAKKLLHHLRAITKSFSVTVTCRIDYEANAVWPHFGFVAMKEKDGRARKDPGRLVEWKLKYASKDLFSAVQDQYEGENLVVFDSNVLIALDNPDELGHQEASSLVRECESAGLSWRVTMEILNEINGHEDPAFRELRRIRIIDLVEWHEVREFQDFYTGLRKVFPNKSSDSDLSDLRQIARTMALNCTAFITRDEGIVAMKEDLRTFGVSVFTPATFIAHLHRLEREEEYRPTALAGTITLREERLDGSRLQDILSTFLCNNEGEKKKNLQDTLERIHLTPDQCSCRIVEHAVEKRLLALMGLDRSIEDRLVIPLLRFIEPSLAPTLARHLLSKAILIVADKKVYLIKLTEEMQTKTIGPAAEDLGFLKSGQEWVKVSIPTVATASGFAMLLRNILPQNDLRRLFEERLQGALCLVGQDRKKGFSDLEHLLWPCKIIDSDIPSFIVPIKPQWALHLFDEDLASQDLIGAEQNLALTTECVYYRSPRNHGSLSAQGRILWYVSDGRIYSGSKRIRACSRLNEIMVDSPKKVFKRFERLGVYKWEDVLSIAKGDKDNPVMALRFDDTELFKNPLDYDEVQEVLRNNNISTTFQSPIAIPDNAFLELYRMGTGR